MKDEALDIKDALAKADFKEKIRKISHQITMSMKEKDVEEEPADKGTDLITAEEKV